LRASTVRSSWGRREAADGEAIEGNLGLGDGRDDACTARLTIGPLAEIFRNTHFPNPRSIIDPRRVLLEFGGKGFAEGPGVRRSLTLIEQLRLLPADLEQAAEMMQAAADEIDRLLTAITNAQSALTYTGMTSEEKITSALGALSFGDR